MARCAGGLSSDPACLPASLCVWLVVVLRVFCALEDGSAFRPDFVWEDLPDFAPP